MLDLLTINSARLKSLADTDERFKYPEAIQFGCSCMASPDRRALSAPGAKDAQESGVPRGETHFFPKINFREFHFRFIVLITLPKGAMATPRGDIGSGIT